jgi:hypothetical protein
MPLASFFTKFDQKSDATFVKSGQGLTIDRRGTSKGHQYQLLGHGLRSEVGVEPYLITLDETADAFPIFQHEGVEFIYMLEGEVAYAHGDQTYVMQPGDSLFFDANIAATGTAQTARHLPVDHRDPARRWLGRLKT